MKGAPSRSASQSPQKEKNQQDDYDQPQAAAGVIAPIPAVGPCWKATHKGEYQDDSKNEQKHRFFLRVNFPFSWFIAQLRSTDLKVWDGLAAGHTLNAVRITPYSGRLNGLGQRGLPRIWRFRVSNTRCLVWGYPRISITLTIGTGFQTDCEDY